MIQLARNNLPARQDVARPVLGLVMRPAAFQAKALLISVSTAWWFCSMVTEG